MLLRSRESVWNALRVAGFWLGVLASIAAPVRGQTISGAGDYVHWSATVQPSPTAPGETAKLVLTARIDEGWKMYAMDSPPPSRGVRVQVGSLPAGVSATGEPRQSEPKEGYDPNFEKNVRYFTGQATIEQDLVVGAGASVGAHPIPLVVTFMICNDKMCLPPTKAGVEAVLNVGAPAAAQAQTPTGPPAAAPPALVDSMAAAPMADADSLKEAAAPPVSAGAAGIAPADRGSLPGRSSGLWAFVLLAMGAGLAALLTPCVFPMIPLTVSYFTRHAHDRQESVRMAVVYGAAIVLTFTALGLVTALVVGAAGAQTIAANPWINLFIGIIFVVFALSLLGLFELRLPTGLLNFFNRASNEHGGYLGVLFMGLTLTLVSFSCTAPFVGALLAAASQGEWTYPIIGMLAFSATFALPFFFFALFPKGLSALPRSGSWMNVVKVVLGFVELAAAIKFISNADLIWGWDLISRPLAIAVVVVIFALTGLYLIGKLRLMHDETPEHIGVGRLLGAVFFFGLSLYMIPGLLGAPLNALDAYLPPRQATDFGLFAAAPGGSHPGGVVEAGWITDDIDAAMAEAQRAAKPLFVDFSGYTCTNCRDMEANIFPRPAVAERFQRDYVLLRLYTDDLSKGEEFQRFQLRLTGTVALPTYAVVDPGSRKVIAQWTGIADEEEFVAFLDEGVAAFGGRDLARR